MKSSRLGRSVNTVTLAILLAFLSCFSPATEGAELDRQVGRRSITGTSLVEADGLAAIRSLSEEAATLYAASPTLNLSLTVAEGAPGTFRLTVLNALSDAVLTVDGDPTRATEVPQDRRTSKSWTFTASPGAATSLRVATSDADATGPFRFAVLSDIQERLDDVGDVFRKIGEDPTIRFVVSTGDLTESGTREEYEQLIDEMAVLDMPLYSTVGNHEWSGDPLDWHELFGPFSFQFAFKGVFFTLVDSGNATVDPEVYRRLNNWLAPTSGDVNVFLTHVPLFDPVGVRSGAFRHRAEAAKLANLLADNRVDLIFYGHVHSYYVFTTADIPTHISGGGGAIEERLDGLSRHFLTVDVTAGEEIDQVAVVRVD